MNTKSITKVYMLIVIALGFVSLSITVFYLPLKNVDLYLALLFIFTVGIGSRITLEFPRLKSHVAVSDVFIFLAFFIYGGEIAIILAALEAFFSSWRFCKKKITVFFNCSVMTISTGLVALTLKFFNLHPTDEIISNGGEINNLFLAMSVMALVQFISNTSLAAIYGALKSYKPIWETWKSQYAWLFITYFVGAFGAGALFQANRYFGFSVIIASFPIILFLYFSYRMYLKNIEMSIIQVEQAEQHSAILERQSLALSESEERFRSAFNYAPIGIALVSPLGNWLKVNRALCNILGYTEEELLDSHFQSMIFKEDLEETLRKIEDLLSGKISSYQMEQRYLHKSQRTVWASWSVSKVIESGSEHPNLIFQVQDITDKKLAEEELQREATHDALTKLPNRSFFLDKLDKSLIKVATDRRHKVCLLFIDLDRFKIINDSLGHFYGDMLLIEIAARLRECLRPNDFVARLGGDEFTILVEGNYQREEVIRIAERIQEKFAQPFDLDGHEVYSSASIGILHNTSNHRTAEEMMRDADIAMYQAKRAGKARYITFQEDMHREAREVLQLENDLRRAIEKDEFSVYYQPIYSVEGNRIQEFEALARWEHETHGFVPPEKFIPLAEEIGLIDILGMQILRKACKQGNNLKSFFPIDAPFTISVNLSCKQFGHSQLINKIENILDETGFAPQNLKLEITESVFIEHKEKAVEMLYHLRRIGIEINIDDFGTGYSNLSYLMRLPISTLKIDRSFINLIDMSGRNLEIIQTILKLAQSLGIKVVAEGVENQAQLDQLKILNCEGAQGYFFAKPMSFENTQRFLENEKLLSSELPQTFENFSTVSATQQA